MNHLGIVLGSAAIPAEVGPHPTPWVGADLSDTRDQWDVAEVKPHTSVNGLADFCLGLLGTRSGEPAATEAIPSESAALERPH